MERKGGGELENKGKWLGEGKIIMFALRTTPISNIQSVIVINYSYLNQPSDCLFQNVTVFPLPRDVEWRLGPRSTER